MSGCIVNKFETSLEFFQRHFQSVAGQEGGEQILSAMPVPNQKPASKQRVSLPVKPQVASLIVIEKLLYAAQYIFKNQLQFASDYK